MRGRRGVSASALTLSRRGLIRSVILALGIDPARVLDPVPRWARDLRAGGRAAAEAAVAPGGLSTSELDDLVAFAELLVEGRPLSPPERAHLVENIEERTARERDYLALYQTTVSLLKRLAGRRFASLDVPRRIDLIQRHRLNSADVDPDEKLGPFADDVRAVRTRALRDLIADYYGSPAGWAVVGYDAFPGRCGDLERYTRDER